MEEAADSVDAGPTPKQRRERSAALKTVSELVGTAQLYAAALATCREVYTFTSDRSIAELRVALLMAIHDSNDAARPVRNWDPEFKFVWMLDACVRDGRIAPRLMRDLIHHAAPLGLADPLNPDDAPPPVGAAEAAERAARLADLALALCGVRSQQLLAREALLLCHKAVDEEALPRDDATARGVCRLIALSAQANSRLKFIAAAAAEGEVLRKSVSDKATAESAGALLQRFLPIVAGMIADDRLRDRAKSAVARKAEPPPSESGTCRAARRTGFTRRRGRSTRRCALCCSTRSNASAPPTTLASPSSSSRSPKPRPSPETTATLGSRSFSAARTASSRKTTPTPSPPSPSSSSEMRKRSQSRRSPPPSRRSSSSAFSTR